MSQQTLTDIFGPVIHSYTRQNAIDDGVLIDCSEHASEIGFAVPVAITRAVYEDCVYWGEDVQERSRFIQDESGRLHDVLWMAFSAFHSNRNEQGTMLTYSIHRQPRPGCGQKKIVYLKANIGPGDNGEPVITIMQPHED